MSLPFTVALWRQLAGTSRQHAARLPAFQRALHSSQFVASGRNYDFEDGDLSNADRSQHGQPATDTIASLISEQKTRQFNQDKSSAQFRVFVGGLGNRITDQEFKGLFANVDGVTHMFLAKDQRFGAAHQASTPSKGFGFVTFNSDKAMKAGIAQLNETNFGNRTITVKEADQRPRAGENQAAPKSSDRVYISNMDYKITEEELEEAMSRFGTVEDLAWSKDPETGRRKPFAHVKYSTTAEAEDAIAHHDQIVLGSRALRIAPAIVRSTTHRPFNERLQTPGGRYVDQLPPRRTSSRDRYPPRSSNSQFRRSARPDREVSLEGVLESQNSEPPRQRKRKPLTDDDHTKIALDQMRTAEKQTAAAESGSPVSVGQAFGGDSGPEGKKEQ